MISRASFVSLLGVFLVLSAGSGCGAGSAAKAVRPEAPTAKEGLGEGRCTDKPLIVDLPSTERVAVEAALNRGRTLLARHECTSEGSRLTLLSDCGRADGYEYTPMTRREEVVRMNDADEVRAQLPLTGAGIAADLSGELSRGSALDLALVDVGRFVSRTKKMYADTVPKECQNATHVVSAISTGAFAMSVGTRARVRAVAEIFAAGTESESKSSLLRATRDGDLAACDGAATTTRPPPGCGAPLRVELVAIDPRPADRATCEDDERSMTPCLDWLHRAVKERDPSVRDLGALLVARCRKGHGHVCGVAREYVQLAGDTSIDVAELHRLGCEGGADADCVSHGENLVAEGKVEEGLKLLRAKCFFRDDPAACTSLGDVVERGFGPPRGPERDKLLANAAARACATSSAQCERYAALHRRGIVAEGEFPKVKEAIDTCAKHQMGCGVATAAHALGIGVPRNIAKARETWAAYCKNAEKAYLTAQRKCEMPKAFLP